MPEQSITIRRWVDAPPQAVYRAFTNATSLREWFCYAATVEPKPGGRFYAAWVDGDYVHGRYLALTADRRIVLRTQSADDAAPARTTIRITPKRGGAEVALIETGEGGAWSRVAEAAAQAWGDSLDDLKTMLETGEDPRLARRPFLGVNFDAFTPEDAARLGLPNARGLRLSGVAEGFGAQVAGLRPDDVIVAADGRPTPDWGALFAVLQTKRAGDVIKLAVYREGRKRTIAVTLSERPAQAVPTTPAALAQALRQTYAEQSRALSAALKGASAAAARRSAPGEWSALEVLAHLVLGERDNSLWVGDIVGGHERTADDWGGNVEARHAGLLANHSTVRSMLKALRDAQAENVALVAHLPGEFAARKAGFRRVALGLLQGAEHTHQHLSQIAAALARGS